MQGNPRKVPLNPTSGPAVNRDLKPGRKKTRVAQKLPPSQPGLKPSYRCSSSPSPFASELENYLSALTIRDPCRRDGHRDTHKADFNPHSKGPQSAQHVSSQRLSLDLETHDLEKRSQHNPERGASKRQHHEWPQTKEDFDQHDFVPMEKPQQTYCEEEDWYVGPCNRADAEHALHLVNKDGAFLVRDCSISSDSEPLVLAVFHDKKVYNVKIRFLESDGKYALGNGQRSNDMFVSVADIIKFHSIFPIVLISGRSLPGSRYPENCVLTCPITKRDVDQLLQ
nr:cytokine-dependent hematopoietic cell linker isoform X2 [Labrus bergylta]